MVLVSLKLLKYDAVGILLPSVIVIPATKVNIVHNKVFSRCYYHYQLIYSYIEGICPDQLINVH